MSIQPKEVIWDKSLPMGKYLGILTKTYLGALTKKLEHLEIERHYSILLLLENEEEHCSQQYLSDALRIDKASMVRIIDHLVEKGFIERVANPVDRREHKLQLTKRGKQALPEIHKAIEEMNEAATTGLSEKEKKNFYRYMRTIAANLESMPVNNYIVKYKKAK
jgi:DNA-binding MarR family transcriptional regulator